MKNKPIFDCSENSTLPRHWFEEAKDAKFFGRPFTEYTFEELSAIAAHGWKLFQNAEAKRERMNQCVA